MNTISKFGRLAAATLLSFVSVTAAQAQVQKHRVPAYNGPQYESRATYQRPVSQSSIGTANGVQFGIRAGVNVADWSGNAVQSVMNVTEYTNGAVTKQTKPGFHAGVYATLPLGPHFAIEPGVLYSEKGTELSGRIPLQQFDFLNAKVTATSRMTYIDVPLVAKAYLTPGLYIYAGPQASFLVSNKVRVNASALGFSAFKQDFDVKNQFRPVDFSATGGIGYQFESGFGLSAGYDYGLTSLDKNNNFDAKNRVVKASLNFSF
ncbi:porin family protein [Hymenobacter sp. BT491]|uniref:porin family protein n=1 Tax=Hymenobacter sp. BT491 TaxID=2766779 RepID=UPI0016539659|nr:porin family protein [Hymenobacter sp. BT491]MBC6991791.1 PorT family protein [Hymenobacter sp. BT491]